METPVEQHHEYSASGAEGWMTCPGKLVMEQGIPDTYSPYADEGSAAHFLGSECLINNVDPATHLGRTIVCWEKEGSRDGQVFEDEELPEGALVRSTWKVTGDMVDHIRTYVKEVKRYAIHGELLVEQRVHFGEAIGVTGAFGTTDAATLFYTEEEAVIKDLKYGYTPVLAEKNPQEMLYALGVLHDFEMLVDLSKLKRIRLVIIQPRIPGAEPSNEWVCTPQELALFAEKAKKAVEICEEAKYSSREFPNMWFDSRADWEKEYLKPSEKGCKWCKAKGNCNALARESLDLVLIPEATTDGLEDLDNPGRPDSLVVLGSPTFTEQLEQAVLRVEHLDFQTIAKLYSAMGSFDIWVEAVKARMYSEMLQGEKHPDWKLVKGRDGNRAWSDVDEVERILKSAKYKIDEMYDKKVISPTAAEKLTKAKPRVWKKVQSFILRPEGKITIAPRKDKREAIDPYNDMVAGLPNLDNIDDLI